MALAQGESRCQKEVGWLFTVRAFCLNFKELYGSRDQITLAFEEVVDLSDKVYGSVLLRGRLE
jgi:hypothetical protein